MQAKRRYPVLMLWHQKGGEKRGKKGGKRAAQLRARRRSRRNSQHYLMSNKAASFVAIYLWQMKGNFLLMILLCSLKLSESFKFSNFKASTITNQLRDDSSNFGLDATKPDAFKSSQRYAVFLIYECDRLFISCIRF